MFDYGRWKNQRGKMKILAIFHLQNDFCTGGILEHAGTDELIHEINRISVEYDLVLNVKDHHPTDHISFAASHPWRKAWQILNGIILWPMHGIAGTFGAENPESFIIRSNFEDIKLGIKSEDANTNIFEMKSVVPINSNSITFCGTNFIPAIFESAKGSLSLGIETLILDKFCLTIGELMPFRADKMKELKELGAKII
jgi:nicotinamidase-related amidase